MTDQNLKLWQLYEKRNAATTIKERDRIERLIEERIRRIGSGQDDAP